MGWKHILEFVTNSLISGSSSVHPGHEGICVHRAYTLLHWWGVITVNSLSLGKRTNVENHSSSLRKKPDLAQCPTKVSPSRMGAASLPPQQPLTPKSPGDAHFWATQRPSAQPAEQAELRNTSTVLQTASKSLCTTPVSHQGGSDDRDAPFAARRTI